MAATPLKLTIALANTPPVMALKSGRVVPEGIELQFEETGSIVGVFRRMVRNVEFDICELAPTTYIIARALGAPFIALPIFVWRRFHHAGLLVRPDAGISHPKDLEGKNVGVRAYTVTTGVWHRGIMSDEYGLDNDKVTWFVDDEEHVDTLKLPENVVQLPPGRSIAAMMRDGELHAGYAGIAGIGREGPPSDAWAKQNAVPPSYPDLISDAERKETDWFRRTGIYPIHGTVVIKDEILDKHPWVARSLYDAFNKSKEDWLARLRSGEANAPDDRKYLPLIDLVGPDPLPYGIGANLPSIAALERYAFEQKLIPRRLPVAEFFADPLVAPSAAPLAG